MESEILSKKLERIRTVALIRRPFRVVEYREMINKFNRKKTYIYSIELRDENTAHKILIYDKFLMPKRNYRILLAISTKKRWCYTHEEVFLVDNKWKSARVINGG